MCALRPDTMMNAGEKKDMVHAFLSQQSLQEEKSLEWETIHSFIHSLNKYVLSACYGLTYVPWKICMLMLSPSVWLYLKIEPLGR